MSKNTDQDVAFIRALADLLRESDLTEIEVEREYGEDDELKVRLTRSRPVEYAPQIHLPVPAPQYAPHTAPAQQAMEPSGPDLSDAVTSPMVGTCYLAGEPGQDNFVSVGDVVTEGQTLLIIEAMKTMNQIPSPVSGTVRAILVDNAEPVEFGAPLMIIA
jgi:acetyl-CoA carboxylase biotin carboxyl carrier protein